MAEMTAQQITQYLKTASDLEMSVYKQKRTKEEAQHKLVRRSVSEPTIQPPVREKLREPRESDYAVDSPEAVMQAGTDSRKSMVGTGAFLVAGSVFMLIRGVAIAALILLLGAGLIWAGIAIYRKAEENYYKLKEKEIAAEKSYKDAVSFYKKRVVEVEQEYQEQYEQYLDKEKRAQADYEAQEKRASANYENAKQQVSLLDAPLRETEQLLEKLYSMDIIFPKYRNLVAVCTMYEYLASGRCTELAGPAGAYNLYESELRQNMIINQLEQVNANLEQVKQNQYILYQGIMEANQALQSISNEVRSIANATKDIAVSSQITAYCSKITAVNAQVQTYLAFLD